MKIDPLVMMKHQFSTVTRAQDHMGIGEPIATNGYKTFVSTQTMKNAAEGTFKDTDRSIRYESAKRVLPFDADNMFQHSVKAGLEQSPRSNESPIKETINKMQSISGLEELNTNQSQVNQSRLSMKHN